MVTAGSGERPNKPLRGHTGEDGKTPPEGDHQEAAIEALILPETLATTLVNHEEYQQECSHHSRRGI
jgi:hypothetical protein